MYTNKKENTNEFDVMVSPDIRWPIHPVVLGAIGLTENETKILAALLTFQMGRDVAKIAKVAGLPRTTTLYNLKKLEKRRLAFTTLHGKRFWWRFKRGLDNLKVKGSKSSGLRQGRGQTLPLPMKKRQKS